MKKIKNIVSMVLCVVLLLCCIPLSVLASTTNDSFEGYTPISTKEDLNNIRNNLEGKYYLTDDIVFSESDFLEGGAFYNEGMGWTPIGLNSSNAFTGIFDGNGYMISNLFIDISSSDISINVGLFGCNLGTIKNVSIINSNISATSTGSIYIGSVSGYNGKSAKIEDCISNCIIFGKCVDRCDVYAGGVAGSNYRSIIKNSQNRGNITAESQGGEIYVGGISGVNNDSSTINSCFNIGAVCAVNPTYVVNYQYDAAGGITGKNYYNSYVTQCYNAGTITADTVYTTRSGGIAGCNTNAIVQNCYNTGKITADDYAGGITGVHGQSSSYASRIDYCYNVGVVHSNGYAGGITGSGSSSSSSTGCFYIDYLDYGNGLTEKDDRYADYAVKCSEDELKLQSMYEAFDFDTIWQMGEEANYFYPTLQGIKHVDCFDSDSDDITDYVEAKLLYGADRFTFGKDITGEIGEELSSLIVYTSKSENIASLSISSSDTEVVKIGTIQIGSDKYLADRYDNLAEVMLALRSVGSSVITITSPEGLSVSIKVNVENQQEPEVETKGFSAKEHGWSFVNGSEGFGYESSYYIPVERYATVFGEEYVAAATAGGEIFDSMIPTKAWGGNCYGMSATSVLFYLGMLDWSNYDDLYENDFSTVNSYYSTLRYHSEFAGLLKWAYASSDINTTVTNLIECYQILQYGSKSGYKAETGSTFLDLENNYYVSSDSTNKTKIYSHNSDGDYISSIYERIIETDEPLLVDMHGAIGGHAMVIRTDLEPVDCGNGWYKVYVYDPNHPYISDSSVTENYDLRSYYLNLDEDDTYIEINPNENKWRYNGSTNSSQSSSYWGCDENYNVKTYNYTENTILPEYMFIYSISDIGYPTEFNGNEEWKSRYLNESSDCSAISFTGNSTFKVDSINGDTILTVTNGVPCVLDDEVEYFPYVGYVEDSGETLGGKLTIPYEEFVINYISGDDISIIDNDSVINIACDEGATITALMSNNDISIESNADNEIVTQITDVSSEKGYTSVYADSNLESGDSIHLELNGDSLIINDAIKGSGALDIYTDNETIVNDKYITTVHSFNNSVTIPDVRNIVNVSSVSVTPAQKNMTVKDEQFALNVEIMPSNATNKTVLYSSSNSEVATVDPNTGIVTAVSNGTAIITVTTEDGDKKTTCIVTVNIPHVHIYDPDDWKYNESSHWYECTVVGCGIVIDASKVAHTPDYEGNATEEYAITCSVCGYIIEAQLNHVHVFDKGDVTGDGRINISDAVQLYYHVNGKIMLDDQQCARGDVAPVAGTINIADAVRLYYFVNGKMSTL